MARLIGQRPDVIGHDLQIMYDFVMNKLPDYICASFCQNFASPVSKRTYECDIILYIPHMGVFILDVSSATSLSFSAGIEHRGYQNGTVVESRNFGIDKLRAKRFELGSYLKEKFNLSPLIYEFECYPALHTYDINWKEVPVSFDPRHVITADDLEDGLTFLRKVIDCSIYMRSHMRPQVKKDIFEDLSDKDAHDLFYFWDTGVFGAKRPERPPFVFLSYNQNNAEISKDIQTALEDRGVYVWRAPKDVPLGGYYLSEEMQAIEDCDAFLILLSYPAQASEEVKKEFVKAREIQKPILPVWVENVPDSDINAFYKENLKTYQFRVMKKLEEEIIEEIVAQVKKIKMETDAAAAKTE